MRACGALVQVELHRMRLSLSEISRERDALRSHVRLLHQQLADNAIHTALDQRKAQQPRPMQARMRRGAGGVGHVRPLRPTRSRHTALRVAATRLGADLGLGPRWRRRAAGSA